MPGDGGSTMRPEVAYMGMEAMESTSELLTAETGTTPAKARRPAAAGSLQPALKRTLDIVLSAAVLAVALPVMALVALAIVIESRGPVFYRAERVGLGGRAFRMLKFRKMKADSSGIRLTTSEDDRLTRVGAFLERTKLDELPQFVNVLLGDMSLIGPRPEDAGFVAHRRADYDVILEVRPGITGFSQIAFAEESRILSTDDPLGHYLTAILPQKCMLDRLYVGSVSVATDLRILGWTVVAVLLRRRVAVDRASGHMNLRRRPAPC